MKLDKPYAKGTVCFLSKGGKICFAQKLKNIGAGFLNGYGGGVENEESVEIAALRELKEESGVTTNESSRVRYVALIKCFNKKTDGSIIRVDLHVFFVEKFVGMPKQISGSGMGPPEWYLINNIPNEKLMPGDREWLPLLLQQKNSPGFLAGNVYYNSDFSGLEKPSVYVKVPM